MRVNCLLVLLLWSCAAGAAERILSFHSDILVQADGSMQVTETIHVVAEGKKIRRGIYRDFPTVYKDRYNNQYRVGFEVLGVRHNDSPAQWHIERRSNGVRIYVGDEHSLIAQGRHSYRIRYRTNRQLGYFEDFDELYWNVTGTRWDFPIDKASARVVLPGSVDGAELQLTGYTGAQGSTDQDLAWEARPDGADFRAVRPLPAHAGLTVVIGWPKGLVRKPGSAEILQWYVDDNRDLLLGGAGFLVLLAYYSLVWLAVGRDPAGRAIYPAYKPPAGYSPAALRYIREMQYDAQAFTAAVVHLAVQGYLEIDEADGRYTLRKLPGAAAIELARGEAVLAGKLFARGDSVTLDQEAHGFFQALLDTHKAVLEADYNALYFRTNGGWMVGGILLSVATVAGMLLLIQDLESIMFTLFISVFAGILALMLVAQARRIYRMVRSRGALRPLGLLIQVVVAGVFLTVLGEFFEELGDGVQWFSVSIVGLLFLTNYLFQDWLKAPTLAGRRLLDQVDGFNLYLSVAEEDELRLKNPTRLTPQRFEALLPFAIALGVEEVWGAKFAATLARAGRQATGYTPHWYHGADFDTQNIGAFSSAVSAGVSAAIAASSSAPGSSSGASGGASGGGGGGGGGGGW